jgi:drug/metabolite transporter (DMT)-like permease
LIIPSDVDNRHPAMILSITGRNAISLLAMSLLILSSLTTGFIVRQNSINHQIVPTDSISPSRFSLPLMETKSPGAIINSKDESPTGFLPFNKDDDDASELLTGDPTPFDPSSLSSEPTPPPQFELTLWSARGLLLLVAAIWGTNFASVKYLEGLCFHPPCHHPPSEAAFARFGIAALVSWPLLVGQPLSVIAAGLECGLSITIGYITQAMALTTIPSGKCAFICSLTVVCVPVLAAVVYKKPIKGSTILAALIALTGVGVLEGMIDFREIMGVSQVVAETGDTLLLPQAAASIPFASSVATATADVALSPIALLAGGPMDSLSNFLGVAKGDLIALGQPLGFGYTFLRIEHYQEQFKAVPNRVLTIAAAQCVSVGLLSFLWVLYDYQWTIPNFAYMIEPHRIATLLWTGIVTTVAAIFLEGIALQKASATDASIAFSSEPVWASLFGFLLLKEKMGFDTYLGGAIIMAACFIGAAVDFKEQEDSIDVESRKD